MKRRFNARDPIFVDREGVQISVTAVTLELSEEAVEALRGVGTIGVGSCSSSSTNVSQDLPHSPTLDEPAIVWQHYVEVMKPRNVVLDPETRKMIREALKVGSVDEWKMAVDGCRASSFHMGENERRRKYNKPSQIFKGKRGVRTTREQLDMFLDYAQRARAEAGFTSADPARVSAAKRAVLDAWEFPGDEQAVRRGGEAEAWLRQNGWRVEREEGTSRPVFVLVDGAAI